jgi:hypothetical protein
LRVGAAVICDRDQEPVSSLEGGRELLKMFAEGCAASRVKMRARPARVREHDRALKPLVPRGGARRPLKGVWRRLWEAPIEALVLSICPKDGDVSPLHAKFLKGVSEAHQVHIVAVVVGLRGEPPREQDHLKGEPTREHKRGEAHHGLGSL